MKNYKSLPLFILSIAFLTGCNGGSNVTPTPAEEDKELTIENVVSSLNEVKNATSYRSIYAKEGVSNSQLFVTQNYIYNSDLAKGYVLLSSFTESVPTASFNFTYSSSTGVDVTFADLDNAGNYVTSIDYYNKVKNISVDASMFSFDSSKKYLVSSDDALITNLLDLIGNDEQEPYEVESIYFYYDKDNYLTMIFKDSEGSNFDEATIKDINSAGFNKIDEFVETYQQSYLNQNSIKESSFAGLFDGKATFSTRVDSITASGGVEKYKSYELEVTPSSVFKRVSDLHGNIESEKMYVLNEDNSIVERVLTATNEVVDTEVSGVTWAELFTNYIDASMFRKDTGNKYKYYGGLQDEILSSLVDSESDDYGTVTSLYAIYRNNVVESLNFLTDRDGTSYSIVSKISEFDEKTASNVGKKEETDDSKKILEGLNKLRYASTTYGFKATMDAPFEREGMKQEAIYTKDAILSYSISLDDKLDYGEGYRVEDGKVFNFDITGSVDTSTNEYTYSFSNGQVLDETSFEDYWLKLTVSDKVFVKIEGETNKYVISGNVIGLTENSPISLYDNQELESLTLTLNDENTITSMEFNIKMTTSTEVLYADSTMEITYGTSENPVISEDVIAQIDNLYSPKASYSSFYEVSLVKDQLSYTGDYADPDVEEKYKYTESEIKQIPYINIENENWSATNPSNYVTWTTDYSLFQIAWNYYSYKDTFDVDEYVNNYNQILASDTTNYRKVVVDGVAWYRNKNSNFRVRIYKDVSYEEYGESWIYIELQRDFTESFVNVTSVYEFLTNTGDYYDSTVEDKYVYNYSEIEEIPYIAVSGASYWISHPMDYSTFTTDNAVTEIAFGYSTLTDFSATDYVNEFVTLIENNSNFRKITANGEVFYENLNSNYMVRCYDNTDDGYIYIVLEKTFHNTSFLDETLVYQNLSNTGDYATEENTDPMTDEEIAEIPYLYEETEAGQYVWSAYAESNLDYSSWNYVYDYNHWKIQFTYTSIRETFDPATYVAQYNALCESNSNYEKVTIDDVTWYKNVNYNYRLRIYDQTNEDYGEYFVYIELVRE